MCLYRNLLLVFGGTGFPFGQNVSNDLYVLDLKRRHWKRCQILEQQPQRVYGAVNIIFILFFKSNNKEKFSFFRV